MNYKDPGPSGSKYPSLKEFGSILNTKTLRVQVPNYHILSKIVTYITTILNPST